MTMKMMRMMMMTMMIMMMMLMMMMSVKRLADKSRGAVSSETRPLWGEITSKEGNWERKQSTGDDGDDDHHVDDDHHC